MRRLLLTIGILLLLVSASCSAGAGSDDANQNSNSASGLSEIDEANLALTEGNKFLDTGETDKAIDSLSQAVKLNPDLAEQHYKPVIDEIAKLLQADPALKLSIDGHTDNTGGAEHNRTLSRARAEAVRSALLARDIYAARLGAQGFGADKPLADNGSDAGRAKNRRVELVKQ